MSAAVVNEVKKALASKWLRLSRRDEKQTANSLGFHHPGYTRIASPAGGQTKR
jgi:hypothetical protein